LTFETAIIAINYNGLGSDKVLASFQWGFTNYGTPIDSGPLLLQSGVSNQFREIVNYDYPDYILK
jgi:hypothetical protein